MDHILLDGHSTNASKLTYTDRIQLISDRLQLTRNDPLVQRVIEALRYFHLLPDTTSTVTRPIHAPTPLDALSTVLADRLAYRKGERDLVLMHHEMDVERRDGHKVKYTSTLATYGTFGEMTAMAKTVGLPAAMGAELILSGAIKERGVLVPTKSEIYTPILQRLAEEGICMVEKQIPISIHYN
jgi:alpha-aminoadipic semialdehyde synthase